MMLMVANLKTKWTREKVIALLQSSDEAVERGIVRLYKLQTSSEQRRNHTTNKNDVGFNACDGTAGSSFAKWLLGMNKRGVVGSYPPKSLLHPNCDRVFYKYRRTVNGNKERVIDRARHIAIKHSKQLVDIANGDL